MKKYVLTDQESKLFNDIVPLCKKLKEGDISKKEIEAVTLFSHTLHCLLKHRGHEPIHSKTMYKNRRVSAIKLEFYESIHAIEDLISIIQTEMIKSSMTC
ncbi:MAG: hypothetical protein K2X69_05585 [Silvanigrellaceae bacterium]|nr:hypothetical protein [Silvanigrellaceae bacterium]